MCLYLQYVIFFIHYICWQNLDFYKRGFVVWFSCIVVKPWDWPRFTALKLFKIPHFWSACNIHKAQYVREGSKTFRTVFIMSYSEDESQHSPSTQMLGSAQFTAVCFILLSFLSNDCLICSQCIETFCFALQFDPRKRVYLLEKLLVMHKYIVPSSPLQP